MGDGSGEALFDVGGVCVAMVTTTGAGSGRGSGSECVCGVEMADETGEANNGHVDRVMIHQVKTSHPPHQHDITWI